MSYQATERNEGSLKFTLSNEGSQSEKATYHIIPTV